MMAEVHKKQGVAPGAKGMLSVLAPWLDDDNVSEIMINKPREVFVEKLGVIERHEHSALTSLYLRRLFHFIANEANQVLDEEHPLLSANLYDGSRVQCVIPPISEHYVLSIRRQSIQHMKLTDYERIEFFNDAQPFGLNDKKISSADTNKVLRRYFINQNWSEFLYEAVKARKNIVISGGTSSGKTTFLNALLQEIPYHERLITLEDTREVQIKHSNYVSLVASKNSGGSQNVSMQDLVQACLRLRPDRIIMGEIRGAEIMDFVSSCSTGHEGSMTSIHANNPQIAFMRMTQMYKLNNVPSMRDADIMQELQSVIDIIVQLGKTPQGRKLISCYYKDVE